jgi:heptosyltransferase-2
MAKILAVRLSSLGDIVLTQPVIEALAQAGHEVELLTKPGHRALAELFPGLARVITSPAEASGGYAVILDWHGTLRARQWISQLRGAKIVRYAKHSWARRLLVRPGGRNVVWNAWSALHASVSVTEWYAEAAQRAGLDLVLREPRLVIPDLIQKQANSLLKQAGISDSDRWVVMAPGAKWPTKQWPKDSFADLAKRLDRELGYRTVLVGGPGEIPVCREMAGQFPARVISLAGQTDVPVLAAVLSQAPLLVCNDSGPMHLGVAAGTRVLAFFGPTVPEFGFAPKPSERVRVLARDLPCRPCSLHGTLRCPLGHHACMKKIATEEAFQVSEELLR